MTASASLIKHPNCLDASEFETTGTIPNGPTSLLWNKLAQTIKGNHMHISSDFVALLISQCSHDRLLDFVNAIGIADEDIDNGDTIAICDALQDASSVAQVGMMQFLTRPHTNLNAFMLAPSISSITPEPTSNTEKALERDSSLCVVTRIGAGAQEVCHIIPYAVGKTIESSDSHFWKLLKLFFHRDDYERARSFIFDSPIPGETNVNRVDNLITLGANVHIWFGEGLVTFIPIRHTITPTNYDIEIRYLCRRKPVHGESTQPDAAELPSRLGDLYPIHEDPELGEVLICRVENIDNRSEAVLVRDGTVITLTTDDLIYKPLPNPDALNIHAAMARIARLSGRGVEMYFEDPEEVDEIAVLARRDIAEENTRRWVEGICDGGD